MSEGATEGVGGIKPCQYRRLSSGREHDDRAVNLKRI